tara:strand:+ start:7151 stop:7984 length:834 start_codon:yes stop_codon:yes gene_type:complete
MKIKHNKKRNTAFVYESIIREGTAAILKKDMETKNMVVSLIKKHFKPSSMLRKDLECFRSLYENQNLDIETSQRILKEAKLEKRLINDEELFGDQSDLIRDINKELSPSLFNNFVPNYRTLATISQIFSTSTSPKNRVILEDQVLDKMTRAAPTTNTGVKMDNLLYTSFVSKFNEKYDSALLEEQKILLSYYISSFTDNSLELKTFLNEEILRLRIQLEDALKLEEITNDEEMTQKAQLIITHLDGFKHRGVDEGVLKTVLKTQQLVKEIFANGSHN